eukprot:TRINITY_DN20846_c0_g2_i2.p1 TRINITY_DN20846_c0_g2~~TRINITY_DN20846_c0_g2_i2.p1  ORF type:complete len:676 (-),score=157.92 TRINITY_DN20846_c0_g2_i2:13-2040(-)
MMQQADGGWRVARARRRVAFLLPDCAPGDLVQVDEQVGFPLRFRVPTDAAAGNLIVLKRDGLAWAVDEVRALPPVADITLPFVASGPYLEMLACLRKLDVLQRLPVDDQGFLSVSVPFCGKFCEFALLGDFLADVSSKLPGSQGARIFATDVCDAYFADWAQAERYISSLHPRLRLRSSVRDLAEEALPPVGLTIGLHPEVTRGGGWFRIISSILQSCGEGLCVFATFYEYELKTLLNMIDMYKREGARVEVLESPFYKDVDIPSMPSLRYLVLVTSPALLSGAGQTNGATKAQQSGQENAGAKQVVRTIERKVQVPIRVLTAKDCDTSRPLPLPEDDSSRAHADAFEFALPAGTEAGDILDIPLKGGEVVHVRAPVSASPGDRVRISKRGDGSWRILKAPTRCAFVLPERPAAPEEKLRFNAPDGKVVALAFPEHARPGDMIQLQRVGMSWTFDGLKVLPSVSEIPRRPQTTRTGPLQGILDLLRSRGLLSRLPVDEAGTLHVSVPFCGALAEYQLLGDFLAEHCLGLPAVRAVRVIATEVAESYHYDWHVAARWMASVHPQVRLETRVCDLAEEALPEAGLTLGIHPEVTWGGCWFQIIGSILRSGARGVCAFATFYDCEMQSLINMVDMYKSEGSEVDHVENPYYDNAPKPEPPPMRHVVLVSSVGVGKGKT